MNRLSNKHNAAFTLLELSVIIVITSILAVAIAAGSHIVGIAKMTRFSTEVLDVKRAVSSFREIYNAWPGDYNGVGTYDFSDNKCGDSADNNIWPNICKGNADSKIDFANSSSESTYARNHLISKNLLASYFSKRFDNTEPQAIGFSKSYKNQFSAYLAGNQDNNNYQNHPKKGSFINRLYVRDASDNMAVPISFTAPTSITLSPNLAFKIDNKFDDGHPVYGNIWGGVALGSNATSARNCLNNSAYDHSTKYQDNSGKSCILRFELE